MVIEHGPVLFLFPSFGCRSIVGSRDRGGYGIADTDAAFQGTFGRLGQARCRLRHDKAIAIAGPGQANARGGKSTVSELLDRSGDR